LRTVAAAIAIAWLIHTFGFNLSTVEGRSMEPTLSAKEWLLVNKFVYLIGSPKMGDIVILKDPSYAQSGESRYLVKRVVGQPGDRIEIANERLYRNGIPVEEPYTDSVIVNGRYGPVVLDAGQYFVMGDNRHENASLDSRSFNAVPRNEIKGRAEYIVWPIEQWRGLRRP
jgi:signal peptidase I, bacterial type